MSYDPFDLEPNDEQESRYPNPYEPDKRDPMNGQNREGYSGNSNPYSRYYDRPAGNYGDLGNPELTGRRKRHPVVFTLLLALLILITAGVCFFSIYDVSVTNDPAGASVTIRRPSSGYDAAPETVAPELNPAQPTMEDNALEANPTGDGTTLNIVTVPKNEALQVDGALTLQEIYKKVIPSVVSIQSTVSGGISSGTGIIMSEDGYIITNYHVIENAQSVTVVLNDDSEYSAVMIGGDSTSDLAVLKIDATGLSAAEFGSSEALQVGDSVVAIGNPLGTQLKGTMTQGIISAINRDISVNGRNMTLLQTDAALNSGNSGGPLINIYGQVIGINTMKMSSYYSSSIIEGLGFAIPISLAKPIVDELIEDGYVSGRPAIGITGMSLPASAASYYQLPEGIYVESVDPSSDAYAKGLARGDVITGINGTDITTLDELNRIKNECRAGDTVTLTYYRSGEFYTVEVTLIDQALLAG